MAKRAVVSIPINLKYQKIVNLQIEIFLLNGALKK